MQDLKHFLIDSLKIGSILIVFILIVTLLGYLMGGKETKSNGVMDYYNNIDYSEQNQFDN